MATITFTGTAQELITFAKQLELGIDAQAKNNKLSIMERKRIQEGNFLLAFKLARDERNLSWQEAMNFINASPEAIEYLRFHPHGS